MSDFVRTLEPSFVSYEALEVACHALESYCDRLTDAAVEKLKVCTAFHKNDLMCAYLFSIADPLLPRYSRDPIG